MVLLSCPLSSGNYSWEDLPLSEMHLGLVFAAPLFCNSCLEVDI